MHCNEKMYGELNGDVKIVATIHTATTLFYPEIEQQNYKTGTKRGRREALLGAA